MSTMALGSLIVWQTTIIVNMLIGCHGIHYSDIALCNVLMWQVSLSHKGFPPIGAYWCPHWYPHWDNKVSIRIKVSPNQDSILGNDFLIGVFWYPHWDNRVSIRTNVSPNRESILGNDFLVGVYWYPHWDNRVSIRINVSPNRDSILGNDFLIGVYWYPHWENRVSIRIKLYPKRNSKVDIDPVCVNMNKCQ